MKLNFTKKRNGFIIILDKTLSKSAIAEHLSGDMVYVR